jgi:hypothetical protein
MTKSARVTKRNSGGIGKKYGVTTVEVLLVSHGGNKNDTIVTVKQKVPLCLSLKAHGSSRFNAVGLR